MIDRYAPLKFLIIRRDNIGDLVCTTPLFEALRLHFPAARIYALTNSYNVPVLYNNPFVDEIFAYTKIKHLDGMGVLRAYWERARLIARLRRLRLDYAILAGSGFASRALTLARMLRPRHIVGHIRADSRIKAIDVPIQYDPSIPRHEVQDVYGLLAPLGVTGSPPSPRVVPDGDVVRRVQTVLRTRGILSPPIAIHISARKPSNRWPIERFVELMRRIHSAHHAAFMLFWSPGDANNPRHPGDDAKAEYVMAHLQDVPVVPYATAQLAELMAGLSVCQRLICSDGGAMHIAAALGKPIVCFFGNSSAAHWHPWGVPYVLLQPASRDATDISVDEAVAGFQQLQRKTTGSDDQASTRQG